MKEYRTTLDIDPDASYSYVDMGPIPNTPDWHQELYASQTYPFPTPEAAERFAAAHQALDPGREIKVR